MSEYISRDHENDQTVLETHDKRTETRACDLISRLSNLRSQYNCFDVSERDAYGTLSEAIKVLSAQPELAQDLPNACTDAISRQAAIDLVRDVCDAVMSGCESWYDPETKDEVYKDIREVDAILRCNKEMRIALRNMPSAQPEIIHCRDCKWHNGEINQCNAQICASMCGEDFCSRAERREE